MKRRYSWIDHYSLSLGSGQALKMNETLEPILNTQI